MLKFLFWILVLVNGALLAWQQGLLNAFFPDGREPARMARQINPEAVKLVKTPPVVVAAADASAAPAAAASAASAAASTAVNGGPAAAPAAAASMSPAAPNGSAAPAAAAPAPAAPAPAAAKAPTAAACFEIGNFDRDDGARFEQRLAALALGSKMARRTVQDSARNMVFIPGQGSKEGADKKAGELRRLGISDFFVIQEGEHRWGISLGVFRSEEAARAHLSDLSRRGVNSARLGQFQVTAVRTAYQFKGLDAKADAAVNKLKGDFPKQEVRACEG